MTERAVYVYSRGLAAARDRHEDVLERLRTLHRRGRIDAIRTWTWPDEVSRVETDADADAVEVFERFERWADRNGASIRPPFRLATRHSTITDETREVLVTPELCLAVRNGDTLVGVFPCSDGGTHYGVDEALDRLAAGTLPGPVGDSSPAVPGGAEGDPA